MAIVLGLGGLYPAAANIPAILRPEEGQTKRVLDLGLYHGSLDRTASDLIIGCGTGVWSVY